MSCPDWFPFSAGLANSCFDLCKQFESHGHEVRVIVAKDDHVDHRGLKVTEVPYHFRVLGRNPVSKNLHKHIKDDLEWCDVVCLFSYMYLINADIVKLKTKGKFNKPIIHFYRGSLEETGMKNISPLIRYAKKSYDKLFAAPIFEKTNLTISNSEPTLQVMKDKFKVTDNQLTYIPNAIDCSKFQPNNQRKKQVIFIGRLVENKGIKYFDQIAKTIPKDWKFAIVGSGPLIMKVLDIAKKYPNCKYLGKLTHEETLEELSNSEILVLPSLAEGAPRVVMEASALGVPSICFDVGDVKNMIAKEDLVHDINDIYSFCQNIKHLIEDENHRKELRVISRKIARERMDWSVVYPKIEVALKSTLK